MVKRWIYVLTLNVFQDFMHFCTVPCNFPQEPILCHFRWPLHKNNIRIFMKSAADSNMKMLWTYFTDNFSHSYCASWHYQSFIYSPTDALVNCFKKTKLQCTLTFTLKQLQHVLLLVSPSSGSTLICAY